MLDLLFDFTDWLRGTQLLDLSFWLTETSVSLFMVENFWMVPIAQVIHILAIAAAFGATLMWTLRINNAAATNIAVEQISKRYVPWIWWGLLVILLTGMLMVTAEPIRNMVNAVFWIKMGLLLGTIAITLAFQRSVKVQAVAAGPSWQASSGTRTVSILIVLLWAVIMVCGRWIAYVPV